jgi:hypothetical protein
MGKQVPLSRIKGDLAELTDALARTGVKDLHSSVGIGGYEGGQEYTFVISYTGNGEARRTIARFAQRWDQDSVLIMQRGVKGTSPLCHIAFKEGFGGRSRTKIERMLVNAGFGGWTWYKDGGVRKVALAYVRPWSDMSTEKHIQQARKLAKRLGGTFDMELMRDEVWERKDYAKIIGGKKHVD